MTKHEHQLEIIIELDEAHLKIIQEEQVDIEAILKNYLDAQEYNWTKHIDNNPKISALSHLRYELLKELNRIDSTIDALIAECGEDV